MYAIIITIVLYIIWGIYLYREFKKDREEILLRIEGQNYFFKKLEQIKNELYGKKGKG